MKTLKLLLGPVRLPFLQLTPACVAVGIGTAFWQTRELNWIHVLLVMIGAVSAHVSVNVFNEYFDFTSGLDAKTARTPFSGGSGVLPEHPELAGPALFLAWTTFLVTAFVGLYFTLFQGWLLLPVGLLGLLLIVTYTIWWAYHPLVCLIAPGLGFGILMVMGTHFALTGTFTWTAFVAALVPSFLVSNLLLLNQFPDVEADQYIGRKHFPITIGRKFSGRIYGALLLMAYLAIVIGVLTELLPVFSLISLITVIIGWFAFQGVRKNAENIPSLISSMGMNVVINLFTPVLLAVGLFVG
ncbi:MAG: prenyltransferase [Desulfobacteraceae bacterium]|nr:prenyltransferase [Desulfobacteraceae bacterium]